MTIVNNKHGDRYMINRTNLIIKCALNKNNLSDIGCDTTILNIGVVVPKTFPLIFWYDFQTEIIDQIHLKYAVMGLNPYPHIRFSTLAEYPDSAKFIKHMRSFTGQKYFDDCETEYNRNYFVSHNDLFVLYREQRDPNITRLAKHIAGQNKPLFLWESIGHEHYYVTEL